MSKMIQNNAGNTRNKNYVAGLILAAGLSTRMGQSKPLTDFLEKKLIDQVILTMQSAEIKDILVVTGFEHERLETYLHGHALSGQIRTIWNPEYENGSILTSIKTGLPELKSFERVFIQLTDLPCIDPETYQYVWREMAQTGKKAVVPTFEGRRGHPVLIEMTLLPKILAYEGAGGLRGFWKQLGDEMAELPVNDPGCVMDTDTMKELREAEAYMKEQVDRKKGFSVILEQKWKK